MLPIARPRYLHPNCFEYERKWSSTHCYNNPSQSYGPPPTSPIGLREVLSSYTTGPTIIMMEKKKKPNCLKANFILMSICILCIFGFFAIGATLYSKIPEVETISISTNNSEHLNVIHSLDEDAESYVEIVQLY